MDHSMMIQLDHSSEMVAVVSKVLDFGEVDEDKFGMVGCVALYCPDPNWLEGQWAQLMSTTSTGVIMNQRYDCVRNSPIIGAGKYANSLCAVWCTAHGECFIWCVAVHDVVKRLEANIVIQWQGFSLAKTVDEVILGILMGDGEFDSDRADRGLIGLD